MLLIPVKHPSITFEIYLRIIFLKIKSRYLFMYAFITSKLLYYCKALLYGLLQSLLDSYNMYKTAQLDSCQGLKVLNMTPVLRRLHWLPIRQRITYKILFITYKVLNSMAPKYLADLLQPYQPNTNLRSS